MISVANHFANIARADVPVAIAQPVPAVQVASTSVTAVPEVRSRPLWACGGEIPSAAMRHSPPAQGGSIARADVPEAKAQPAPAVQGASTSATAGPEGRSC